LAVSRMAGLPPIDVYKIGEVYFVKDGNHRVSVARQGGAEFIQAWVTEIKTRVPLTPDVTPDDLIVMAEYLEFLEHTHLDEHRPDANLRATVPGKYSLLEEQIAVHRYYMAAKLEREITFVDAAIHWYDTVYMPAVQAIQGRGILRGFPKRTEADLYLWISEHRAALEEELGWKINPEVVYNELASQINPGTGNVISRFGEKLFEVISQGMFESGPPAGQWRKEALLGRRPDRLFSDILVPLNGEEVGWFALEQARVLAAREDARLHGLHVVLTEDLKDSEETRALQIEFEHRCEVMGVEGQLVIAVGEISRQISNYARWTDLVVTNLAYPPGPLPFDRLDSGFRDLIQRCPRPVLATPQTSKPLKRALLAYDGSPKADEALFVATYISGRWQIPLTVMSIQDNGHDAPSILSRAKTYLEEHGVSASYAIEMGAAAEAILNIAETRGIDLIIMGGYGYNPVVEMVLGSAVDQVLRESHKPVLICR
jgi:nucleotide-binding universal stress UspA family protein